MEQSSEQRDTFKVTAKRHAFPVGIVILAVLTLMFVGNPLWRDNFFHITLTGLPEAALKVSFYLLVLRYGFPKLKVQDEVIRGNIAMAILAGAVFIGIANIF
jgi:hypothetical protein